MRKEKLTELQGYIRELSIKNKQLLEKEFVLKEGKLVEKPGFIRVEKYNCELENGITIPREKIVKGGKDGNAAVILPITKEGNTILVVQPRVFTKQTVCVELPAGYVEDQEDPMIAGKRELLEETGYLPEHMHLLASYYQDQGCSAAYNYSFLATGCKKVQDQQLDKDEFIRYFECQYEEALELMDTGYITDIQSQYTLEKSKTYMKRK